MQNESGFDYADKLDSSEMDGKYLTFWLDGQLYGVPIADVVQIVKVQEITEIPEFPPYAKGIINLRGAIIPVVDVRLRFGKAEAEWNERTCIIITSIRGREVGFIVDQVEEVSDIPDGEVAPPPVSTGIGETFLTGLGKHDGRVTLLLDTRKILSETQVSELGGDIDA